MNFTQIENHTRVLGAPADWAQDKLPCDALAIRDVELEGTNFMVSEWKPTDEELLSMIRGETIKLWIAGKAHPVVALTVGE